MPVAFLRHCNVLYSKQNDSAETSNTVNHHAEESPLAPDAAEGGGDPAFNNTWPIKKAGSMPTVFAPASVRIPQHSTSCQQLPHSGARRNLQPKCQTPLHGHRLRMHAQQHQRTKICHIAMPEPNISACQDVGMWQIFVRWW